MVTARLARASGRERGGALVETQRNIRTAVRALKVAKIDERHPITWPEFKRLAECATRLRDPVRVEVAATEAVERHRDDECSWWLSRWRRGAVEARKTGAAPGDIAEITIGCRREVRVSRLLERLRLRERSEGWRVVIDFHIFVYVTIPLLDPCRKFELTLLKAQENSHGDTKRKDTNRARTFCLHHRDGFLRHAPPTSLR